jgi:hypothetical protein
LHINSDISSLQLVTALQIYLSMALRHFVVDLCRFFSFLILYTVGRTPWTGDQPVARPLPTHRINSDIHASNGIRIHDSSVRAGEDCSCLRPRSHCDRHTFSNSLKGHPLRKAPSAVGAVMYTVHNASGLEQNSKMLK